MGGGLVQQRQRGVCYFCSFFQGVGGGGGKMGANTPLARWIPTSDPNPLRMALSWRVAGGLLRSNSSFNFSSNADAKGGGHFC